MDINTKEVSPRPIAMVYDETRGVIRAHIHTLIPRMGTIVRRMLILQLHLNVSSTRSQVCSVGIRSRDERGRGRGSPVIRVREGRCLL
jgi:hypothetical protein